MDVESNHSLEFSLIARLRGTYTATSMCNAERFRTDQDLQRWIASTKCIIADLPPSHKTLLRELCYFLNEVRRGWW